MSDIARSYCAAICGAVRDCATTDCGFTECTATDCAATDSAVSYYAKTDSIAADCDWTDFTDSV